MTRALLLSLVFVGGTACMHAGRTASAPATGRPGGAKSGGEVAAGGMGGMCPMSVPGTEVVTEDTTTGEAVTFTTKSADQVAALRERVHAMADMHNAHHAGGDAGHAGGDAGHGGMHGMHGGMGGGGTSGGGMEGMEMPPPSQATVEDLPDGARILVAPKDPADLQRLQSTVRRHATHMREHGCPMMDHAQHGS